MISVYYQMVQRKDWLRRLSKTFIFLSLVSSFVLFFLKDQIIAFAKKRSTISSRFEHAKALQFPTLVLCLDPATKLTVAQKYGFERRNDKFKIDVPGSYLYEVFHEITYLLNRDFEVNFHHGEKLKHGQMLIQEYRGDREFLFDVQDLRTYTFGICVKLEPKFEVFEAPLRFVFTLSLKPGLNPKDQPKSLAMHFTSNRTWINVVGAMYPQFKSQTEIVDFEKEYTHFFTKVIEKQYDSGTIYNLECVEKVLKSSNCTNRCEILSYIDNLPFCESAKDLQCMWFNINYTIYTDCFKTKSAITYSLQQRIENPIHKDINRSSTTIYVALWSMEKEIQEEVPLLTTQDFIGSIGGSLGMFFGFSFSASFFFCIDKLFK